MAKLGERDLHRAERAFDALGLLLRHDARLPSFTALIVGEPVRGSWWSHPQTHEIYDLLQRFHAGAGALSVKLVNGKVTYVHRRLWPALLGAASGRAGSWQLAGVSRAGHELLGLVRRAGELRADEIEVGAAAV